jgi:peptidoglycan hydrolase CwlO-like protein
MSKTKASNLLNYFALLGAIISMVTTIVYGTWFISTIEKRVAILEQNNLFFSQRIQELRNQLDVANDSQDKNFHRFEDSINNQMSRMEDKIEKIYTLIRKTRVKDTGM